MQVIILLILYVALLSLYYLTAPLKKVSQQSQLDFAIDADEPDDILSHEETTFVNKASTYIFISVGLFIWSYAGITVAKIALFICNYISFKWLIYLIIYFVLLRIPFGLIISFTNKIYEVENDLGKTSFALILIASYILTIIFYNWLPYFLQWPL